jgi:hypothetical protein
VCAEQLVVVDDDAVVNPDHRAVPDGMVVGRDGRMPLGVVTDVDEELGRVAGYGYTLEELRRGGALLDDCRLGVGRRAVCVSDGIGAALRNRRQERLRRKRPRKPRRGSNAVAGDSAHVLSPLTRSGPESSPTTVLQDHSVANTSGSHRFKAASGMPIDGK